MDLFEKIAKRKSPLGQYSEDAHHYYTFPKLEGELAPRMMFRGKEVLNWSLNNYLGLGNHPDVRKADADAAANWGCAYPMGARMMSGNTDYHEQLEQQLAEFEQKEDAILLNFGYQGILSAIDALVDRRDVIVYDAESHACIIDGVRLHQGKRFVFGHNDIESLETQLQRATKMADEQGGAILVISEGVFGMSGNQGKLKEIVALKSKFDFRLMVDDAHGFGTLGPNGEGAGVEQGVQDEIDVYFSTFAKSMASIGAFIAGDKMIINYLRYSMRSQIFAKSLPMPFVIGALKRLDMLRNEPHHKANLWKIVDALQGGLKAEGFNIGTTSSCVTPVILQGNVAEATHLTRDLRENFSIFCSIVVYPVVPKDVIMLRLIPTAAHSLADVEETIKAFQDIKGKLLAGEYKAEKLAAFN
ncbi:pyridoxal phosphate-dependent aminotransferase family protein [Bacteroidia bacterium]|jgi:glycine C-acetyltransferase|nr:pyridoxal phosphate-dependent aminotransferase family protein [Bacteroidota bacterium]MDB4174506.1 pyridoxal phosphate-dependent aminotransferase family protein [Bacteroidia bacterium]